MERHTSSINGIGSLVFRGNPLIGVKIIVVVQSVDVVAFDDIGQQVHEVLASFRDTRVEEHHGFNRQHPVGVLHRQVVLSFRVSRSDTANHPERVDPGVQLHPAFMGFFNGKRKRVPGRAGREALLPGQVIRPGLQGRRIHRVAFGTDLEKDRINTRLL